jgi:hypothetical protein
MRTAFVAPLLGASVLSFSLLLWRGDRIAAQTAGKDSSRGQAIQEQAAAQAEKKNEIQSLRSLHAEIVGLLKNGKEPDEELPKQTFSNLTSKVGYRAADDLKRRVSFDELEKTQGQLRYRDALKADEDLLVSVGADKVTVEINAQPQHCQVAYVEVATGANRAFGQTKASKKLDPKYYDFICDCLGTAEHALLDCTSDQSYTFDCGSKAP